MLEMVCFFLLLILAAAAVAFFATRMPIADSPWFWVYVFSTSATVALFVMDGKYNHRQGHIEDEYRYGTKTLAKPSPDASLSKPRAADAKSEPYGGESLPLTGGPQPLTHELLISLAPLRFLAISVMIVSCLALQWQVVRGAGMTKHE